MTFAYFDTSALVKRYVREQGSTQIRSLMRRYDLLSSAITPVEILSAIWRRQRDGDLSDKDFSTLLSRVQGERIRWELVEVGDAVLTQAEKIIQIPLPMRTLDAVHVASLITFQAAASVQIPFVTSDARQRDAATHLELDVVWIG